MLIDPPFSRLLSLRADPERYNGVFLHAAAAPGAALFSRYDLTRRWVDLGELDIEQAISGERAAALGQLHECLARALSRALLDAAADPTSAAASR